MKRKIYLSLFLIIISGSSLFGQFGYAFPQFFRETGDFIKQPINWDGSDWLKLGVVSTATFLMMETADQPICDTVLKDQRYYKSAPIVFSRMWEGIYSPIFNQDNKTLPSGYSTAAFILSTVLSRNIKSPDWKTLVYLPAELILISRVYQGQHWVTDAFTRAALGYFVATWVVDHHENNNNSIFGMSPTYLKRLRLRFEVTLRKHS
ncbi:MAG: phosphatase PAP2 family protein [Ignavibacteriales bacterium]|nr:phosphatase PAP2 family protein [Ignavibacteriales bacterium]